MQDSDAKWCRRFGMISDRWTGYGGQSTILAMMNTKPKSMSPEQILKLRTKLDETQAEFADRPGVSKWTIVGWELGRRDPSGMALRLLEKVQAETK